MDRLARRRRHHAAPPVRARSRRRLYHRGHRHIRRRRDLRADGPQLEQRVRRARTKRAGPLGRKHRRRHLAKRRPRRVGRRYPAARLGPLARRRPHRLATNAAHSDVGRIDPAHRHIPVALPAAARRARSGEPRRRTRQRHPARAWRPASATRYPDAGRRRGHRLRLRRFDALHPLARHEPAEAHAACPAVGRDRRPHGSRLRFAGLRTNTPLPPRAEAAHRTPRTARRRRRHRDRADRRRTRRAAPTRSPRAPRHAHTAEKSAARTTRGAARPETRTKFRIPAAAFELAGEEQNRPRRLTRIRRNAGAKRPHAGKRARRFRCTRPDHASPPRPRRHALRIRTGRRHPLKPRHLARRRYCAFDERRLRPRRRRPRPQRHRHRTAEPAPRESAAARPAVDQRIRQRQHPAGARARQEHRRRTRHRRPRPHAASVDRGYDRLR